MSSCGKLFRHRGLYDQAQTDALFFKAVRENTYWHIDRCENYREILKQQGFDIERFNDYDDLFQLPPIPTLYLKRNPLYSMPVQRMRMVSTTTGTSGQPVSVGFDPRALLNGAPMLYRTLQKHKLFSMKPTNYVILGYQPSKRNQMGAVRTAYVSTFFAPARHREFALKDNGSDYELNIEGVLNALCRYQNQKSPVRIHGFPAYLYFLTKKLEQEKLRLTMPAKSMIFLGGGWKQFASEQVEKRELYELADRWLGIPESQFREFFGVVEHNVPYCDCKNHHFHVPIYSRVLVRDIQTLRPQPFGEPGILNLITPLLKSMPLTSILTDDIAVLYDGKSCGCGIETPYFEILGRAGLKDIKTCTAGAASILEAGQ